MQQYQTNAREVWVETLKYDKVNKTYNYYINFLYGNWSVPNQVALVFDKEGNFLKTELFVYFAFRKKTIEETEKDHMLFSLNFKETAEKLINALIKPIEKEEMVILLEKVKIDKNEIVVRFNINKMAYCYTMNWKKPNADELVGGLKEEGEYYFKQLYDIPSLEKMGVYIRTHPNIRVKYVNELAQYEQAKKKIKQI